MPSFFTGLRISVTYAFVAAILAEFVGSEYGIGVYMTGVKNVFRTDLLFGAVLLTAGVTLILFAVVVLIEHLVLRGRRPAEEVSRW